MFADEQIKSGREHIWLVELHFPYCDLAFGQGLCYASGTPCFNTKATCKALDVYAPSNKIYKFCEARENMPIGMGFIPSVKSVSITPAKINPKGGIGTRSACTVSFVDHPHSDIGIDKYRNERPYNPFSQGSFWGKFRARNLYYRGCLMRVWSGYLADNNDLDTFDYDNAQKYDYFIENISQPSGGTVTVQAKDILKLADDDTAVAPKPSNGRLSIGITSAVNQIAQILPMGVIDEYPSDGFVKIGDEVCEYTKDYGGLKLIKRGLRGTEADAHDEDEKVQLCLVIPIEDGKKVYDIVQTLLVDYANVDPVYLDMANWVDEVDTHLPFFYELFITEPTGVRKLLDAFGQEAPHYIFWDERDNLLKLRAIKEAPDNAPIWTDTKTFLADSVQVADEGGERVSHVIVNFDPFNITQQKDPNDYRQTAVKIDADSAIGHGTAIRTINAQFFNPANGRTNAELAMTAIIGRFANLPRKVSCEVLPKDASVWTGDCVFIEHEKIQLPDGSPFVLPYQVLSVGQGSSDRLKYELLQWSKFPDFYAGQDEPPTDTIFLSGELLNLRTLGELHKPRRTLRDFYDMLTDVDPSGRTLTFVVTSGSVLGSDSVNHAALDVGAWPIDTGITLVVDDSGVIAGKGGDGGYIIVNSPGDVDFFVAEKGGAAIKTEVPINIDNRAGGVIGGGGGGGAIFFLAAGQVAIVYRRGGGGAGFNGGAGYEKGTLFEGGDGDKTGGLTGGDGGALGENGADIDSGVATYYGGLAGYYIDGDTHVTWINKGDVRGRVN